MHYPWRGLVAASRPSRKRRAKQRGEIRNSQLAFSQFRVRGRGIFARDWRALRMSSESAHSSDDEYEDQESLGYSSELARDGQQHFAEGHDIDSVSFARHTTGLTAQLTASHGIPGDATRLR